MNLLSLTENDRGVALEGAKLLRLTLGSHYSELIPRAAWQGALPPDATFLNVLECHQSSLFICVNLRNLRM